MKDNERPLWELSRDEQRVLIITFVGGLASIVAGACVIGGAIALVRGLRAAHFPLYGLIIFTAVNILLAGYYVANRSWIAPENKLETLWIVVCLPVPLAILLLAWIGLAAGIH